MRVAVGIACLTLIATQAMPFDSPKFRIDGERLIYDTENVRDDVTASIESEDIEVLRAILQLAPEIEVLELNSGGGSVWGAQRMSDIILKFELDTHVNGECESTCTRMFLSGVRRTMATGGQIGFHRKTWDPQAVETYYDTWAEEEGWRTPFDFTSQMYEETQQEVFELLSFLVSRGVDADFAIQTQSVAGDSMWRPSRSELLSAGVLTE